MFVQLADSPAWRGSASSTLEACTSRGGGVRSKQQQKRGTFQTPPWVPSRVGGPSSMSSYKKNKKGCSTRLRKLIDAASPRNGTHNAQNSPAARHCFLSFFLSIHRSPFCVRASGMKIKWCSGLFWSTTSHLSALCRRASRINKNHINLLCSLLWIDPPRLIFLR